MGSIKLTKNADLDKYKHNRHHLEFDSRTEFSLTDVSMGENVIIFVDDMTSSVYIDYEKYLNWYWRTNIRIRWYYINNRSYISC